MSGLETAAGGNPILSEEAVPEAANRPPETLGDAKETIDGAGIAKNDSACHSYHTWRSFVNLQIDT